MRFLLLLSLLSIPRLTFAEDWKPSANADFKTNALYYPQQISATQGHEERLSVRAPMGLRYKKNWRARVTPLAEFSPGNSSPTERDYLEMQEAYLQWQSLPVTVLAGLNTVSWGATDVFNPLDVINQHIYYDPLQSEKRGAPMLMIKTDFSPLQFEAIYIPKERRTLLPGVKSRWLPRDVYKTRSLGTSFGPVRLNLPSTMDYSYSEDKTLDHALINNFGFRTQLALSGVDLSAIAYDGVAATPAVGIKTATLTATSVYAGQDLIFDVDPAVGLQATFYRERVFGASAVVVMGDTLLKTEAAYTHVVSKRTDLPDHVEEYVMGLERNLNIFKDGVTALLQGTYVRNSLGDDGAATSLSRMFDKSATLGLRYAPEKWSIVASGLYDIKYKGKLGHFEVARKLSDPVEIKLTCDILAGKQETPIGTYRKNDRFIAGLVYHL